MPKPSLSQSLRTSVRQGNLIPAVVLDTHGDRATVRLSNSAHGAIFQALEVTGGPVAKGQRIKVDFTTNPPTIVAPGKPYDAVGYDGPRVAKRQRRSLANTEVAVTSGSSSVPTIPPYYGAHISHDDYGHTYPDVTNTTAGFTKDAGSNWSFKRIDAANGGSIRIVKEYTFTWTW